MPNTNQSKCECSDRNCPEHAARAACVNAAETTLYRIDTQNASGTAFCEACAEDAIASGVFSSDAPSDEDDDEPTEGDYQINSVGELGSKTAASIVNGRFLGTFDTDAQALRAIRERGNAQNFWPNVWNVHGNAHLVEGFEWDSRGTWHYSYGDEDEDEDEAEDGACTATFTLYCAEPEEIKRDLSSIAGSAIENADGLLVFTVDADAVDAAIEELRDANFEAKEGS